MLIEFTVGNFRSFREKATLSLVAAADRKGGGEKSPADLIETGEKDLRLVPAAVLYGANASGKSNLIRAVSFMRRFAISSVRESQWAPFDPFRFDTTTRDAPSHFEVLLLLNGEQYRYGFEATRDAVTREWLYVLPTIREIELFYREGQTIERHERRFREGRGLEERTRPNALYLSVCGAFNGEIATRVLNWFRFQYRFERDVSLTGSLLPFANQLFEEADSYQRQEMTRFIQNLDVGIQGLTLSSTPDGSSELLSRHEVRDKEGRVTAWEDLPVESVESDGTQRLIGLTVLLFEALEKGHTLFVDELDAHLHPNMTCAIVRLFQSKRTNPRGAQLVFATHDSNLLDPKLFRRDQIWFTEKDRAAGTRLYSLAEFRRTDNEKVRPDAAFERDYLTGRYGAVPYLGDLSAVVERLLNESDGTDEVTRVDHAAAAR